MEAGYATAKQLAANRQFPFTEHALAMMRYRGEGPSYVKVGRRVLYKVSDVEAWLDSHTVHTGGAA